MSIKKASELYPYCTEPNGNVGRIFRHFVMKYYASLLSTCWGSTCVLLLFGVYMIVAIWGCLYMRTGLTYSAAVPNTSYLRDFLDVREKYFNVFGEEITVLFNNPRTRWWDKLVQDEVQWMNDLLKSRDYTVDVYNGMSQFLATKKNLLIDGNQTNFIYHLEDWLTNNRYGRLYRKNFKFDRLVAQPSGGGSPPATLIAWKLTYFQRYLDDGPKAWNWLLQCRKDAGSGTDVTPYAPEYETTEVRALQGADRLVRGSCYYYGALLLESDPHILTYTLQNMAIALLCIMGVALLLIPSLCSMLLVLLVIVMIDIGLFGFMSIWGVKMNLISMVNLIISIGFSIDHTAHVVHSFAHCVGPDRVTRMKECLVVICTPVFHGAVSTWLALFALGDSSKNVLVVFFKMMTLVLVFSVTHGAILLPVLLSAIGPMENNPNKVRKQTANLRRMREERLLLGTKDNKNLSKVRRRLGFHVFKRNNTKSDANS